MAFISALLFVLKQKITKNSRKFKLAVARTVNFRAWLLKKKNLNGSIFHEDLLDFVFTVFRF